ncbi:MAG: biotin/lipoyl-binding protein [Planctomycetes bacterium]|nr:biotin/lipoyl-binding protein [Planctomycetota bacterium]MCB9889314.1 biotin/lipoyl-binding protein [Planctomycetota bacterium]
MFRTLPFIAWLGAIAVVVQLFQFEVPMPHPGEARPMRLDLTAPDAGRLAMVLVSDRDVVERGQVLARLDGRSLELELRQAKARLQGVTAQIDRERRLMHNAHAIRVADYELERRRYVRDRESVQVDCLISRASLEEDRIRLQGLKFELKRIEQLSGQSIAADADLIRVRTEHDAVRERIRQREIVLRQQQVRLTANEQRIAAFERQRPPGSGPEDSVLFEPFRWEIDAQRAVLDRVELLRTRLAVVAPEAGRVEAVLCYEGQQLQAGQRMLVIVAARPRGLVVYVPDLEALRLRAGTRAEVRLAGRSRVVAQVGESRVESIGLAQAALPAHLLVDPSRPQWARPVFVEIPKGWRNTLLPGQAVRARFLPD